MGFELKDAISEHAVLAGEDVSGEEFDRLMSPSERPRWEHGLIAIDDLGDGRTRERRWFCGRRLNLEQQEPDLESGRRALFASTGDGVRFWRVFERTDAGLAAEIKVALESGLPLAEDTIRRELRRDVVNSLRQLSRLSG